jgi:ketosteroid isomerase-like protein
VGKFREGKIIEMREFHDMAEALKAVGLAESAVSQESTPPELDERVRQGLESLGRRDFDGFMSAWAPDAMWDLNAWGIGTFEGLTAIRRFAEDWLGNYEEYLAEPEQILDLGNDVAFVAYREVARPMGSQGRLERRQACVVLERQGLIERMTMYADLGEARAAAEQVAEERA